MSDFGKVFLIGAGPGDPGLLTLRGKEILERADVVVYDRLVSPAILSMCNANAKMVDVGKMPTHHKVKQSEINKLLVQFAREYPQGTIARLKGGDPFVFGRGGEEALELVDAGVEFEIVPGITSAISVPAYAGIPVSHRGIATSFHIITGHEKENAELSLDFEALAKCPGPLIFLMGIANMDFIARRLIECGKDPKTPLAFIEKGTTPYQRTVLATLETAGETIVRENVTAPAITIMGGVVELGKTLAWKKNLPLSGKRLVVTRAAKQSSGISTRLAALGAEVIETPMIETRTLERTADFKILTFSPSRVRTVSKASSSSFLTRVATYESLRARRLLASERLPKRSSLSMESAATMFPKTTLPKASESCLRPCPPTLIWSRMANLKFSSFRATSPTTLCSSIYRTLPAGLSTKLFLSRISPNGSARRLQQPMLLSLQVPVPSITL